MKKQILPIVMLAMTALASDAAQKDPVLMTVNGVDVPLSEFEYLYHKNNAQQTAPQSLDEYVDMFVTYKLKVEDAKAAGIDTTQAFVKEFAGYRDELSQPYLKDAATEQALIEDMYSHMTQNVNVDHIMLPLVDAQRAVADSLRAAIACGADFLDIAERYSIDPSRPYNHGRLGWVGTNMYPYEFEEMIYNTPVGEVSPVFTTDFGYHIVRVNGRRDNPGELLVSHILKRFDRQRPPSEEDMAAAKSKIDSIYSAIKAGADFSAVAMVESEDPGSARNGGQLPWFGPGRMVPEFEKAAYSLADGEISAPTPTAFGYHIIKRIAHRGVAPIEEAKASILEAIGRGKRASQPRKALVARLQEEYGARVDRAGVDYMLSAVKDAGAYDSTVAAAFASCHIPVLTVGDSIVTVADYIASNPIYGDTRYPEVASTIEADVAEAFDNTVIAYENGRLEIKYPEFRSLIHEYRDGMLLFEISNAKVWDRSVKDKSGLEEFFNNHRDSYKWDSKRYKGYVIYTTSDSMASEINRYLAANPVEADSVSKVLRREFPREVKVDKVIMAQGDNAVIDAIAFGAPAPDLSNERKWKAYVPYMGRVIDAPEEAADVRGAVTADYQNCLEKEWVAELHAKYPVKINRKILKRVK